MIKNLKIRAKLTLINTLCILIVFLLAGGYLLGSSFEEALSDFHDRTNSEAIIVAHNLYAAVLFDDVQSAMDIISSLASNKTLISAKITTEGTPFTEVIFQTEESLPTYPFTELFSHRHVVQTIQPLIDGTDIIGELTLTAHDYPTHIRLRESLVAVVGSIFLALIIGALLSSRFQMMVAIPLQSLSNLARKVTTTKNYKLRSPRYYNDEVGDLSDDFNAMLKIIEEREQELETTVAERTLELRLRNQELSTQMDIQKRLEDQQQESEARFKNAFFNAPIGMALISKEKQLFLRNDVFNDTLDLNESIEYHLHETLDEQSAEKLDSHFQNILNTPDQTITFNLDCQSKSGTNLSLSMNMSAVLSESNEFRYAVIQLQDVTQAKQLSEQLEYQAMHDALTGLPNRRVLHNNLQNLFQQQEVKATPNVLCMLDLDKFKLINDACGHAAGDEMLCDLSCIISTTINSGDLLVRLGGDEFAILMYNIDVGEAHAIANKVIDAIRDYKLSRQGIGFNVGASMGIIGISPEDNDTSILLQKADMACFMAKSRGRNRVHIFHDDDQVLLQYRGDMHWIKRFKDAFKQDNFILYTQKYGDLQNYTEKQHSEIILHLRNPEDNTTTLPDNFIPAAKRCGLLSEIDCWTVDKLVNFITSSTADLSKHCYWVTLSSQSIYDNRQLDIIENTIKHADLAPGNINFKITASAALKNTQTSAKVMERFHQYGCRFALVGIGTGFTPFERIKTLPLSYLKIEGLYIHDILINEVSLVYVTALIEICEKMGVKTVAEFVENDAILNKMKELGATFGQGLAIEPPKALYNY